MNYYLLVEAADAAVSASQDGAASLLTIVYIVGFLAAAGFGSIAWYNSKRPVGWEEKERPDIVPPIEK